MGIVAAPCAQWMARAGRCGNASLYLHSEEIADLDELPADFEEGGKYIALPHKNDLGLGRSLALRFAEEHLSDDFGKVREIFGRRGAYARFKDLLERRGMLNRWYEFEESAQKEALREWCKRNEVDIDG